MPDEPNKHSFGGKWTEQKLDIIERYLSAYTTALKHQPFRKSYIDAFAGTGYRTDRDGSVREPTDPLLLPELADREPQELLEGSVRRALRTEPPFDDFTFIEKDKTKHDVLLNLKYDFPRQADKITIVRDDANSAITKMCADDWRSRRAVLFLDPYGMQVDWSTTVAIAQTSAIDLWWLFPVSAIIRMLGAVERFPAWESRLERSLGTNQWQESLQPLRSRRTLFGVEEQRATATVEQIGQFLVQRLESVFPGVAQTPAILRNCTSSPLYLLCFAAGNERGGKVALRIANHILKAVG